MSQKNILLANGGCLNLSGIHGSPGSCISQRKYYLFFNLYFITTTFYYRLNFVTHSDVRVLLIMIHHPTVSFKSCFTRLVETFIVKKISFLFLQTFHFFSRSAMVPQNMQFSISRMHKTSYAFFIKAIKETEVVGFDMSLKLSFRKVFHTTYITMAYFHSIFML